MILKQLVASLARVTASGPMDAEIHSLTPSSKEVGPGVMFAALRGSANDGHRFIDDALSAGASAILAETAPPSDFGNTAAWLHVPDSRAALAEMASALAGHPWRDLAMAGVTGTNGKTTTAFLIHHVMKTEWHRAGLLGTVLVDDGETVSSATHTTPDPVALLQLIARMRDHGCRGVAMEVSSHGIHQKRVASIGFDACVFTNLSQDHLDYHGTMDAYFRAKADWFHALAADPRSKKPVAVINTDDSFGAELADELDGKMPLIRFGFGVHCDFRANNFMQSARGMEFELAAKGKTETDAVEIKIDAPRLTAKADKASGEAIAIVAKLAGTQRSAEAKLNLTGVEGSAAALRIANFKLPERLELVDKLPTSLVGKVLKRQLREAIVAKIAREGTPG